VSANPPRDSPRPTPRLEAGSGAAADRPAADRPAPGNPFGAEVIAAICDHMNADHGADSLLIVRALGGRRDAIAARMIGMDGAGADFVARLGAESTPVRVQWSAPLSERAQVRPEIVRMYQESCAILGVAPRQPAEH
jgi:hypothetical protein